MNVFSIEVVVSLESSSIWLLGKNVVILFHLSYMLSSSLVLSLLKSMVYPF